jgi:hypothetical protein
MRNFVTFLGAFARLEKAILDSSNRYISLSVCVSLVKLNKMLGSFKENLSTFLTVSL